MTIQSKGRNVWSAAMLTACASLVLVGCNREPDANAELEKAVAAMEAAPPPPAPRPAPARQYQPTQVPQQPQVAPSPPPAQDLNQAMAAYNAGQFEDAVTRLQRLRSTPVMTPQQRIALNDAMAAVMNEIYTQAAQGDPRAIQAVKQYERMLTQGR